MNDNQTKEDLEKEISRLKKLLAEKTKPQPLKEIHMGKAIQLCKEYIDALAMSGKSYTNYKTEIFEAVMESVFGNDIWIWVQKQDKSEGGTK